MKKVLEQAEALAGSILDSEVYVNMRLAEQAAMHSEEAVAAMTDFMEKRQAVEAMLANAEMDHSALAAASQAMEDAEKTMDQQPDVKRMQESRAAFTDMMAKVNKIIRFVVTGENDEEEASGCGGSCEGCSGCQH